MRVLRILTRSNLGGPARQLAALAPHFDRLGVEQTLVLGSLRRGEAHLDPGTLHVVEIPELVRGVAPFKDRRVRTQLESIVRAHRPQLIHSHTAKAGWLAARLARRTGIPLVHSFHGHVLRDYYPWFVSKCFAHIERRLDVVRTAVTCVSESCRRELESLGVVSPGKSHVIVPAVDDAIEAAGGRDAARGRARSVLGLGRGKAIAWCGRLEAVKDPDLLFEVLDEEGLSDCQVRVFGDGSLRARVEAMVARRGARSNVAWLGAEPRFPEQITGFDVLLSTSRREGFPVAAIEALLAGVPVVAPRVPGYVDLEGAGVTLTERTPGALARAVHTAEAPPTARIESLRRTHAPARIAERYDEIYRELVESRGK